MKVLIIGSMGFIGSHAYQYFFNKDEVWGADVVRSKQKNYTLLQKNNLCYESIFQAQQFDICINASGNGSVPISLSQPVFDFELNVVNTIKLLDAIRVYNPLCRFINMSSAAVYGNPSILPVNESCALLPISPYGWHKFYAEQICKEYHYLYNLHTVNLRLFSIFGEGLCKQLFWDTYQKCKFSYNIELYGTGNETRDFIYVADLMNAIQCIIDRGLFNGEAVNVGSGSETTIKEAVSKFCDIIDKKINITFNKIVKPGDPLNWKADVSILNSWGFTTGFSLNEGLENTVNWLKMNDSR